MCLCDYSLFRNFVAPELIYNDKYTSKCDWWSCGVVLYVRFTQKKKIRITHCIFIFYFFIFFEKNFQFHDLVLYFYFFFFQVLLSGSFPFHSENPTEIYEQILECNYNFKNSNFNNISKEGKDLIIKLLNPNPKTRYSYKKICSHPWIIKNLAKKN